MNIGIKNSSIIPRPMQDYYTEITEDQFLNLSRQGVVPTDAVPGYDDVEHVGYAGALPEYQSMFKDDNLEVGEVVDVGSKRCLVTLDTHNGNKLRVITISRIKSLLDFYNDSDIYI